MAEQVQGAFAILRRKQVEARTGLRRSSIYQKAKDGQFPRPIKLGDRASGWIASEVEAWIAERIMASREGKQ